MNRELQAGLNAGLKALKAGQPADALQAIERVRARATELEDEEVEMLASGLLAPAFFELGKIDDARTHAERALELADARGDADSASHYRAQLAKIEAPEGEAVSRLTPEGIEQAFDQAGMALTTGLADQAIGYLEPLVEASRQQDLVEVECSAAGMLAQALVMAGRPEDATEHATRALELAEQLRDPDAISHFKQLVDSLGAANGSAAETVERSQTASRIDASCQVAGQALQNEQFDEALALLQPALEAALELNARETEANVRGLLAQALLSTGDLAGANKHAVAALEIAEDVADSETIDGFRQLVALTAGWMPPGGTD